MARNKWEKLFSKRFPCKGATKAELKALTSTIGQPLSEAEVQGVNASQRNPFNPKHALHATWKPFDPRTWQIPAHPLPATFLDFLKWSNGGAFINGERTFDPIFSTTTLRDYLVGYCVPKYMPGALPFALDGGSNFYLFDMRADPVSGEYPEWHVVKPSLSFRARLFEA
jgi:hypothetical protein